MISIADFRPQSAGQRWAVRLLFLLVVLEFFAGVIVRKKVREPYPGLFMPAFAGYGLEKMTDDTGEMGLCRVTIRFTDGSTKEMSPGEFTGRAMPGMALPQLLFRPENGHAVASVPTDLRLYLRERARLSDPGKTAMDVTFQIYRETFRLDRPHEAKLVKQGDELTIPLP